MVHRFLVQVQTSSDALLISLDSKVRDAMYRSIAIYNEMITIDLNR
jgi:hypothetical protein